MFPNYVTKTISFGTVLNGISKTLNVVNQIIPIYSGAKPIINNTRKIISALGSSNANNNVNANNAKIKKSVNKPIFFS